MRSNPSFFHFSAILLSVLRVVDSLACYTCVALNYRQQIISRVEDLQPDQTRNNLTSLFIEFSELKIRPVEVHSSCADVPLTTQAYFLRTPYSFCGTADKCVKMNFNFRGEKIVLRNCLSNLMRFPNKLNFENICPPFFEESSNITIGELQNVTLCKCESDLCNSRISTPIIPITIFISVLFFYLFFL